MKVRQGFVSNSSSSSFCLFGLCDDEIKGLDRDELEEIMYSYGDDKKTFLGVRRGIESYHGKIVIGIDPYKIDCAKTLNQVKDEVIAEVNRLGATADKEDVGFMWDGGYDG